MIKNILLVLLATLPLLAQETDVLTLQEAWRMALERNPGEAAARARLEQAEARYRQVRAAYQPRLAAGASGTRIGFSDTARERNPALDSSAEEFEAGLRATYLLWDGGARAGRRDAARAGVGQAEASLGEVRLDLLAAVGRAFTAAQLARENLRIATADAEFQNRQLEDVKRREAAGVASRADRLNFDIRRLAAENAAVSARATYEAAMSALGALLGLEADAPLPPPAPFDPDSPPPTAPAFAQAWQEASLRLPALEQATRRVEAARAAIAVERGAYRPTISAFGGITASRSEDPAFATEDVGHSVGLQVSWDLWDGGSRANAVHAARAALAEAEAGARQVLLNAQSALEQALTEYAASVEAERLTRESLALSRENRDLVEAAYRAGQESLLRLNEAQRDFTTAEARAAQARLNRERSWIDVLRAMGSLGAGE